MQRWYDNDPTISMAVSLLQNAPEVNQDETVVMMEEHLKSSHEISLDQAQKPMELLYLFPRAQRRGLGAKARQFLEVMKSLPEPLQQELGFAIIHHLYHLECNELQEFQHPEHPEDQATQA